MDTKRNGSDRVITDPPAGHTLADLPAGQPPGVRPEPNVRTPVRHLATVRTRRLAVLEVSATDMAALETEFPGFRIWRESTGEQIRFVAQSRTTATRPHTLVTADLAELRAELSHGHQTADPASEPTRPNIARMYNNLLGGDDHGPADRNAIDRVLAFVPELPLMAWANRAFHQRAAMWMARHGITQFIDLGCGLPARELTHQAVHRITPQARVAYVDFDPYVVTRLGARLNDTSARAAVFQGDVREPEKILTDPAVTGLIDLTQPCGLLLTAMMHFVPDAAGSWRHVSRLCSALAPGNCLALSHATADAIPPATAAAVTWAYQEANARLHLRSRSDIERFFTGLDILAPYDGAEAGLCRVGLWGCEDPATAGDESSQASWCAVARRP